MPSIQPEISKRDAARSPGRGRASRAEPALNNPHHREFLRSLGDPPLPDGSVVAGHYVAAVVERAATLATALAASAGLLNDEDDDQDAGRAPG